MSVIFRKSVRILIQSSWLNIRTCVCYLHFQTDSRVSQEEDPFWFKCKSPFKFFNSKFECRSETEPSTISNLKQQATAAEFQSRMEIEGDLERLDLIKNPPKLMASFFFLHLPLPPFRSLNLEAMQCGRSSFKETTSTTSKSNEENRQLLDRWISWMRIASRQENQSFAKKR